MFINNFLSKLKSNSKFLSIFLFLSASIAFILHSWIVTNGLPYHTDANESFSAYVQGQNMRNFDPIKNSFLPDDAPGKHSEAHPFTYTHGPNLPRYFSYILSLLGIESLSTQILVSALLSLFLSAWFIIEGFSITSNLNRKTKNYTFGIILLSLFCTDFLGVLQFIVNLWRTWHFPLFWGCVWATRKKPNWIFVFTLFFLVFQLEFLFATFTFFSCLGCLLWENKIIKDTNARNTCIAMLAGIFISLSIFIFQLITFYGWKGFLFDLKITYIARNSNKISWEMIRKFYEANNVMMWPSSPEWKFKFSIFLKTSFNIIRTKFDKTISVLFLFSIILPIILTILEKRKIFGIKNTLIKINNSFGPLFFSIIISYLIVGAIIPGYTLNGYAHRWAPLIVFPLSLGMTILIVNMAEIIASLRKIYFNSIKNEYILLIIWGIFLTGWCSISLKHYEKFPDFIHKPKQLLSTKYKGKSFVSGTTFPHMISYYTGKWAYYSPMIFSSKEKLDQTHNWNADRYTNSEYLHPEYYLCQALPYNPIDCKHFSKEMKKLGHQIVEEQEGFSIIRLNWPK